MKSSSSPEPAPVLTGKWPPNYDAVRAWRDEQLARFATNPDFLESAKAEYAVNPIKFICGWIDTYDPRKAATGQPPWVPMILFKRQAEFVEFIVECIGNETSGLAEKARDMGVTWTACALSIWLWLYYEGASIGWGSYKQPQVDRLGDMDSIFEKLRKGIERLPRVLLPKGFDPDTHMFQMRIINPENGNTITGEVGTSIGRGGRKLVYFKDESAHYEHPELIEAALMDNTRVQIDISSVNGIGNPFYRKRDSGVDWQPGQPLVKDRTNVFVMDWRDHPEKTQAWYDNRKAKATAEGLQHLFAQEVDRDYAAAVIGTIIPAEWVKACIDAHKKLGFKAEGNVISALDVADEGGDTNAQSIRKGVVLTFIDEWGERDPGLTGRRAIKNLEPYGKGKLWYDAVGVGVGVKTEANRLNDEKKLPKGIQILPWQAAATPLKPDDPVIRGDRQSPKNKEMFANLKAQGWWMLRLRCEKTWRAITHGEKFNPDELISFDSEALGSLLHKLVKELSQPTSGYSANLKLVVNKKPDGTKSPNLADCVMMNYWPHLISTYDSSLDWV